MFKPDRPANNRTSSAPRLSGVLLALIGSPQRLLLLWNWKSALLSVALRGPIFLVATFHRGWRSVAAALLTESIFCVVTAGFYGAVIQIFRDAQPEWLTIMFLTLIIPSMFQVLEYWMHWLRHTPHLRPAEITSILVSAISAWFNWYAMRRGTLLVGGEGRPLAADLRRLPILIAAFLSVLPRIMLQRIRDTLMRITRNTAKGECL